MTQRCVPDHKLTLGNQFISVLMLSWRHLWQIQSVLPVEQSSPQCLLTPSTDTKTTQTASYDLAEALLEWAVTSNFRTQASISSFKL